jgi:hypothetical protein
MKAQSIVAHAHLKYCSILTIFLAPGDSLIRRHLVNARAQREGEDLRGEPCQVTKKIGILRR